MQRHTASLWLLIAALAFVFGYFGIDKFVHPDSWIGWLPAWMDGLAGLPKMTWLYIVGAGETVLAVLLLIPVPKVRKVACVLIALHFVGILTQVGWNDIAVRDIGLMIAAIALFFMD